MKMDSIYDAPRRPPVQPVINNIRREPLVPDVSVVENSFYGPPRCFKPSDVRPPCQDSFINMSKKQVRFQSYQGACPPAFGKENVPLRTNPDLRGETFKQIYMANVPDRHLDLSMFGGVDAPPQAQKAFNTHNNAMAQTSRPVKSIEKRPESPISNVNPPARLANEAILPKCTEIAASEPTIKDLFHIIQQQNEQIMQLQRQVSNLKTSLRPPDNTNSPTKKGVISIIDVKTANFEVLYHPSKSKKPEATIQEIFESGGRDSQNVFLQLDGPIEVGAEEVSGATPNIDISMKGLEDYQSSEDDDEAGDFGRTLYNGLMNQINKALGMTSECPQQEVSGQTIKAVKQATLQHLKTMGVNLSPIQESNEITGGGSVNETQNYDQEDVSFAVKQLLMKYLPDDNLVRASPKQKPHSVQRKSANSELSFATVQYLEKYNIIGGGKREVKLGRRPVTDNTRLPRFLDVTALKLQSKLDYKK